MPKIPTFTSQVRMTAETGQQAPVIQQDLSKTMASAFAPAIKTISDFAVKEKLIQDKAEALDLENQSIIELNTATQQASKLLNKEEANTFLRSESARIRETFGSKASNSSVKNLFNNNYLLEEQKGIYKTDNAVYKNIVQHSNNQKEIKAERLYRDFFFGDNKLSKEVMYNSLIQLENDDLVQDDDTRAKNIALIPRKLDFFTAKQAISKNPVEALKSLADPKQFTNLNQKQLDSLRGDAKQLASPEIKDNAMNYLAALKVGKKVDIDEEAVKVVLGKDYYQTFKEEQSGLEKVFDVAQKINTSPIGSELEHVNSFEIRKGSEKLDIELQQGLRQLVTQKRKAFIKDPAGLVLGYNPKVKEAYNDYISISEQNPTLKQNKFKDYTNLMKQTQMEMGKKSFEVKLMTKGQAMQSVTEILNPEKSWKEQKNILDGIVQSYGKENAASIFSQLKSEKLPSYVVVAMATNSQPLQEAILSSGKTKDLEKLVKTNLPASVTLDSIKVKVSKKLQSYENIINSQPEGSVNKEQEILDIRNTLYKAALHEINVSGLSVDKAATKVTDQFLSDYTTSPETYFIPVDVNGTPTNKEAIIDKADRIKLAVETTDYIDRFFSDGNFTHYAKSGISLKSLPDEIRLSTDEVFNSYVKDKMKTAMKKHSKWLLNSSSTGITLYVETATGTIPIINSKGEKIEFFFTKPKDQDPSIKNSIESFEPGTGNKLIEFEEPSVSDYGENIIE